MRLAKFGKTLVALAVVSLFLCGTLARTARAADLANAKKVYAEKCAKCHGDTGKGDGPKAKTLKKKPKDYTNKAEMAKLTDADLKKGMLEGKKPMPSYKGKLDDKTIDDLIAYVRTFAK
jgi:mono/diheme cytochrome c family protein